MAPRHGKEFRKEAIRLALTSGLTRQQVAEDLGIGFSALNRCIQLLNVENPTPKSAATCFRVRPLVRATLTASCLNSAVRFVPIVVLLLRIIRG